ncbi:MAG TPA: hypothetical protein PKW24_03785 [Clostridiales bacterium]|jgi:Na+-transporting methylmalonyl-CoA/oxaloacetate decarboxylase gamma subunit|nr:hypothetical protein [Clostridiales bacterium]
MNFGDFFNMEAFLASLPLMAKGMAGIFIVTSIIVLSTYLLNRFSKTK